MNKVAAYLQEHISGDVTCDENVIERMSRDGSILKITPEIVIFPRTTNDIRKVARFCWQLAEKGHKLTITARGNGSDQTGAAIGNGIVLSLGGHMKTIYEHDTKQKLVRLQPGVTTSALQAALNLQKFCLPALPVTSPYSSVGGAVMNNANSITAAKHGVMREWVAQTEVVLASGEVIQTGRISKKELNKKKGLQTFEGEIYRSLDNLISDNQELIEKSFDRSVQDNVGYESIADVKRKDGSFDLTPLFVGSQGTLGIISEMILRTDFVSHQWSVAVIGFNSREAARDSLDEFTKYNPTVLNYYDGSIFSRAASQGKKFEFLSGNEQAIVVIANNEFSDRHREKMLKKIIKYTKNIDGRVVTSHDAQAHELLELTEVTSSLLLGDTHIQAGPPILDGIYVPAEQFDNFEKAMKLIEKKHQLSCYIYGRVLDNLYFVRFSIDLNRTTDKQKLLKILDEVSDVCHHLGLHLIGQNGEGRLKAQAAYKHLDKNVLNLFTQIKTIFDPFNIMNPGVKQPHDNKELYPLIQPMSQFQTSYPHVPYI